MARMTHDDARNLCAQFGINRHPLRNWYRMSSSQRDSVLCAADAWGYRKPRNANGSRGRYFYAYLAAVLERE